MVNKQERQPEFYCWNCGAKLIVIDKRVKPCKPCSVWNSSRCAIQFMRGYSAGFVAGAQVMGERFESELEEMEEQLEANFRSSYEQGE